MSKDIMPSNVGLNPEQEDQAWAFYEDCGSMAMVARTMQVAFHHVRIALNRDPIRLSHVRACRAEAEAGRWQEIGKQGMDLMRRVSSYYEYLFNHIDVCLEEQREFTDIPNPYSKTGKMLTPMAALQWLMTNNVHNAISKGSDVAIRNAGYYNTIAMPEALPGGLKKLDGPARDPSSMTDEDLLRMVEDLRAAGRSLPWGVQKWVDDRGARSRGADTGS